MIPSIRYAISTKVLSMFANLLRSVNAVLARINGPLPEAAAPIPPDPWQPPGALPPTDQRVIAWLGDRVVIARFLGRAWQDDRLRYITAPQRWAHLPAAPKTMPPPAGTPPQTDDCAARSDAPSHRPEHPSSQP